MGCNLRPQTGYQGIVCQTWQMIGPLRQKEFRWILYYLNQEIMFSARLSAYLSVSLPNNTSVWLFHVGRAWPKEVWITFWERFLDPPPPPLLVEILDVKTGHKPTFFFLGQSECVSLLSWALLYAIHVQGHKVYGCHKRLMTTEWLHEVVWAIVYQNNISWIHSPRISLTINIFYELCFTKPPFYRTI